jgi:hypothetical protein
MLKAIFNWFTGKPLPGTTAPEVKIESAPYKVEPPAATTPIPLVVTAAPVVQEAPKAKAAPKPKAAPKAVKKPAAMKAPAKPKAPRKPKAK